MITPIISIPQLLLAIVLLLTHRANAYHRAPCTSTSIRRQFQYSDCYAPRLNPSIPLSQASFVMAHDAATGYLPLPSSKELNALQDKYAQKINKHTNHRWNAIGKEFLALYGKTQRGTVYDQLNDGARALDLRPKMYNNGTIGFHRGSLVDIPLSAVTLGGLLEDAKQWCKNNPKELVIIFHSSMVHEAGYNGLGSKVYMEADDDAYTGSDDNQQQQQQQQQQYNYQDDVYDYQPYDYQDDALQQTYYQDDDNAYNYQTNDNGNNNNGYSYFYTGIAKMKEVYENHGVPYYPCKKLSGLTVEEAMELADLSQVGNSGGGSSTSGKGYLMAVDRHDVYGELEYLLLLKFILCK
jgi:hypothetical protein